MTTINIVFQEKSKQNIILKAKIKMPFSELIQSFYKQICASKKDRLNKKFFFQGNEISQEDRKLLSELGLKDYSVVEIKTNENMITSSQDIQVPKGLSKINFKKTLYYFLPKNYKSESKKIINKISKKYAKKTQKNISINNNINEISQNNSIEVIKDIDIFSTIIKEEIEREKSENPEKIITASKAIESPDTSNLFAMGVFASFLENNGTEVIIKKKDDNNNTLLNQECLETCMTFASSEIGMSKKYEMKFDLSQSQNELLLSNEEEAEKFLNKWKKILSKEMSIPEESIIFFNPRRGSFIVDVKFLQEKADELFPKFKDLEQRYKELMEIRERVLLKGCILSEDFLDSNYNKQLGTWNRSNTNRGKEPYYPPHGWLSFGINMSRPTNDYGGDDCWIGKQNTEGEWIVVYHGIRNGKYTEPNIVKSISETHLRSGWNQYHETEEDIRHHPYGNGKCNKCDRQFYCVKCEYEFIFDECSDKEKICRCNSPKKYKCNQCLHGVYCTPKPYVFESYATYFSVPNSEEKYKIAFMCRADPLKIRQSGDDNDYYICSGESDEIRPYRILIKEYSISKIEEWTRKKIISIIFDSDQDNWDSGKEFSRYIIDKSNLLFMIDDMEYNRFGGYISSKITGADTYIKDPNAFIFSLKSNGRLPGPTKFNIKDPDDAFTLITTHDRYIFAFGGGYDIKLDSKKTFNYANSNPCSYDFGNNTNALYGKIYPNRFTPKRWVVYQME